MARRLRTTAKVVSTAKRNIRKAQLSRTGTREIRSVGRLTRSRLRYSRPVTTRAGRTRTQRRTR